MENGTFFIIGKRTEQNFRDRDVQKKYLFWKMEQYHRSRSQVVDSMEDH